MGEICSTHLGYKKCHFEDQFLVLRSGLAQLIVSIQRSPESTTRHTIRFPDSIVRSGFLHVQVGDTLEVCTFRRAASAVDCVFSSPGFSRMASSLPEDIGSNIFIVGVRLNRFIAQKTGFVVSGQFLKLLRFTPKSAHRIS